MRGRVTYSFLVSLCILEFLEDFPATEAWTSNSETRSFKPSTALSSLSVISSTLLEQNFPQDHEQSYMPSSVLPPKRNQVANSTHRLSRLEIQKAINDIKRFVEERLESDLHLTKVKTRIWLLSSDNIHISSLTHNSDLLILLS
jgi:hypothetical protein